MQAVTPLELERQDELVSQASELADRARQEFGRSRTELENEKVRL